MDFAGSRRGRSCKKQAGRHQTRPSQKNILQAVNMVADCIDNVATRCSPMYIGDIEKIWSTKHACDRKKMGK